MRGSRLRQSADRLLNMLGSASVNRSMEKETGRNKERSKDRLNMEPLSEENLPPLFENGQSQITPASQSDIQSEPEPNQQPEPQEIPDNKNSKNDQAEFGEEMFSRPAEAGDAQTGHKRRRDVA